MATRSTMLALTAAGAPSDDKIVFTCPNGRVALVKDVILDSGDTVGVEYDFYVFRPSTGDFCNIHRKTTGAVVDIVTLSPRFIVLLADDELRIFNTGTVADRPVVAISGALLPSP